MNSDKPFKTWGKNRSVRLSGYDYSTDRPVHVTLCTEKKQSFFESNTNAEIVLKELVRSADQLGYRILCYCLMPDHLHIVLSPGQSGCPLSRFLNIFKGRSSTILRNKGGLTKVWQRSAFDHVIRSDENLRHIVKYIVNNPVRRRIADRAEQYPFAAWFDTEIGRYV